MRRDMCAPSDLFCRQSTVLGPLPISLILPLTVFSSSLHSFVVVIGSLSHLPFLFPVSLLALCSRILSTVLSRLLIYSRPASLCLSLFTLFPISVTGIVLSCIYVAILSIPSPLLVILCCPPLPHLSLSPSCVLSSASVLGEEEGGCQINVTQPRKE